MINTHTRTKKRKPKMTYQTTFLEDGRPEWPFGKEKDIQVRTIELIDKNSGEYYSCRISIDANGNIKLYPYGFFNLCTAVKYTPTGEMID